MLKLGIVAHSAEGGALCFITACREGQTLLGPHMHPEIVLSAIPMGLSMPGWEADQLEEVAAHLRHGVEQVYAAGADFFIMPDNTAHIALEAIADRLPIPGLHIAHVVCEEIRRGGWTKVGLLGTRWTMTGPAYARALGSFGMTRIIPSDERRHQINNLIFDELCQGVFRQPTTDVFLDAIRELREAGAECVILGCTEIPLIINEENSPLPVLDSTRLLAQYGVRVAVGAGALPASAGWLPASLARKDLPNGASATDMV
jgi:aspartate racemase